MRRGTLFLSGLLFFLLCFCTRIIKSRAAEGPSVDSDTSGDDSYETPTDSGEQQKTFPLAKFEQMFFKLAREIGLGLEGSESQLHLALERMFAALPEGAQRPTRAARRVQRGLLKKILTSRMERQPEGGKVNLEALMEEISAAMQRLQHFKIDKETSTGEAVEQLSRLSETLVDPGAVPGISQYLEQSAKLLKDLLPALRSDEEL